MVIDRIEVRMDHAIHPPGPTVDAQQLTGFAIANTVDLLTEKRIERDTDLRVKLTVDGPLPLSMGGRIGLPGRRNVG